MKFFSVLPLCFLCLGDESRLHFQLTTKTQREHREIQNDTNQVQTKLPSLHSVRIMSAPHAGVAKLVYALDSKSSEVHSSCRFESDLRHQLLSTSQKITPLNRIMSTPSPIFFGPATLSVKSPWSYWLGS